MANVKNYYHDKLIVPDMLKRAASFGGNTSIGFIKPDGREDIVTYRELLSEASYIASGLAKTGLQKGDNLIIATDNNRETILLLWGCFLLGVVPTILQPPPTFSGYNPPVVKLFNVYEQLGNPLIFMSAVPQAEAIEKLAIRTIGDLDCSENNYPHPQIAADDVAFIQFSSGSTGDPKGIMLTHSNIIINCRAINIGLHIEFGDVIGNWMPLFHDMALIGYHLAAMYNCLDQWHIETIDFIKNPGLWLNMLSDKKVKVTGCPNFGLALTVRHLKRMKQSPAWDFTSVEALLNGAEPVSVQIMNDFIELLQPYNFRHEAMMPVYGLAEATLAVTFTPFMQPSVVTPFNALLLDRDNIAQEVEKDDPDARLIVSVGVPINDVEIMVVDHNYLPVNEGVAGLICLRGKSLSPGYYLKASETQRSFFDGWFNTGDIGFFYNGHYYISGRHKDIIFKNGRHYFANDLEELSFRIDEISYGKICFAGVTERSTGKEILIAFLAGSVGEKAEETFRQLRNLLRSTLGITIDKLVMVRSNEIPKTSSGKLQRYKLIQRYLAGDFEASVVL